MTDSSIDSLIVAMQHEDSRMRLEAVEALERIADPRTATDLYAATYDWSTNVRDAAVRALKTICHRFPTATPLAPMFEDKLAAISILEGIGDPGSVRSLSKMLQVNDREDLGRVWEDTEIRCAAAQALGRIGTEAAKKALTVALDQLDQDVDFWGSPRPHPEVREAIQTALQAAGALRDAGSDSYHTA